MLAVLLTLALASSPHPDLLRAEEALEDGRFQEVLPLLHRVRTQPIDDATLQRTWELEALTHLSFDATDSAVEAFRRVLGIDPHYRLPARSSPKVRSAFEQAAALGPLAPPRTTLSPEALAPPQAALPPAPSLLRSPWLWVGVAAVAAGAVGGAVWAAQPSIPEGNLGRFPLQ